jgi:ADP-ribose pyrophosphatase YjhB (NUDIX family)
MNPRKYCYDYPRPALTTDCIIFGFDGIALNVLLIERKNEPFKGFWAFPGGFVNMDEDTETGAKRELFEETGLKDVYIEQLYTFSDTDRDPRGRVISVTYYALVRSNRYNPIAGDDAKSTQWFPVHQLPALAFDHEKIFEIAYSRLKNKIRYQPVCFELLNEQFTFPELLRLYEVILDTQLDRRNFRKKMLNTGLLIPMDNKQPNVPHKAARYFRFDREKYKELRNEGLNFRI